MTWHGRHILFSDRWLDHKHNNSLLQDGQSCRSGKIIWRTNNPFNWGNFKWAIFQSISKIGFDSEEFRIPSRIEISQWNQSTCRHYHILPARLFKNEDRNLSFIWPSESIFRLMLFANGALLTCTSWKRKTMYNKLLEILCSSP